MWNVDDDSDVEAWDSEDDDELGIFASTMPELPFEDEEDPYWFSKEQELELCCPDSTGKYPTVAGGGRLERCAMCRWM
jgi:hypothetical protein